MTRPPHVPQCPLKAFHHSDAARRFADEYNLHRIGDQYGSVGKWIAVRLDDGSSDHVLYDTKQDAIRHQHHNEKFYAFVRIVPTTMNVCDAEIYLGSLRKLYDAGFRLTDPDNRHGGPDVIKRITREDQFAQMRGRSTNLYLPN